MRQRGLIGVGVIAAVEFGLIEEDGPPAQVLSKPRSEHCRRFLANLLT